MNPSNKSSKATILEKSRLIVSKFKHYIGCKAIRIDTMWELDLLAVYNHRDNTNPKDKIAVFGSGMWDTEHILSTIRLLLNPLSSMTWEQAKEFFDLPANAELVERKLFPKDKKYLTSINKFPVTLDAGYVTFEYRWQHEDAKRNLEDGYAYSEVALKCDIWPKDTFTVKQYEFLYDNNFDIHDLRADGLALSEEEVVELAGELKEEQQQKLQYQFKKSEVHGHTEYALRSPRNQLLKSYSTESHTAEHAYSKACDDAKQFAGNKPYEVVNKL